MGGFKRKPKKAKEPVQCTKKKTTKLDSVCDVERALSESKDSASAVSTRTCADSHWSREYSGAKIIQEI